MFVEESLRSWTGVKAFLLSDLKELILTNRYQGKYSLMSQVIYIPVYRRLGRRILFHNPLCTFKEGISFWSRAVYNQVIGQDLSPYRVLKMSSRQSAWSQTHLKMWKRSKKQFGKYGWDTRSHEDGIWAWTMPPGVCLRGLAILEGYWKILFYLNGLSMYCKLTISPYLRKRRERRDQHANLIK